MTDSEGYSWSMCCICSTGKRIAEAQGAPLWNGTDRQHGKTGLLTRPGAKSESKPVIYARGCQPDTDGTGDLQSAARDESRDQVSCGHTDRTSAVREADPMDIVWDNE